jgi:hypothetical protein
MRQARRTAAVCRQLQMKRRLSDCRARGDVVREPRRVVANSAEEG